MQKTGFELPLLIEQLSINAVVHTKLVNYNSAYKKVVKCKSTYKSLQLQWCQYGLAIY